MRRTVRVSSLVAAFLILSACSVQAQGRPARSPYVKGELLVQFKPGTKAAVLSKAHSAAGAEVIKEIRGSGGVQLVRLPPGVSVQDGLTLYRGLGSVLHVEPNYIRKSAAVIPNDPYAFNLWNFLNRGQTGGTQDCDIDAAADPFHEPVGAWDITTGSADVVVAVLDTGVDHTHPDLAANVWFNSGELPLTAINGIDNDFDGTAEDEYGGSLDDSPGTIGFDDDGDGVVDDFDGTPGGQDNKDNDGNGCIDDLYGMNAIDGAVEGDTMDDAGHGTHVAGTIGAVGNNSEGVVGVNWDVKIMALKFLDADGYGTVADSIECMYYIADKAALGDNVVAVNASYGWFFPSDFEMAAIYALLQRGILFVAAAGNEWADNDELFLYPASYDLPNIISVAATDHNDFLAYFSSFGRRTAHVGAPGDNVWSTLLGGGYGPVQFGMSGTSMAAPHVAGLVGLLYADPGNPRTPVTDWSSVRNLILTGGDLDEYLAGQTVTGRRVNARKSLVCSNREVLARIRPTTGTFKSWVVGTPEDYFVEWDQYCNGLCYCRTDMTLIYSLSCCQDPFINTLRLSALHVNCDQPAGEVVVNIGGQNITLLDNGDGLFDYVAGDGVYSGHWDPPFPIDAEYVVSFPNQGTTTIAPTFDDTFTVHVRESRTPYVVAAIEEDFWVYGGGLPSALDGYLSSGLDSLFTPLFYTWEQILIGYTGEPKISFQDDPDTHYDDVVSPFAVISVPSVTKPELGDYHPVVIRLTVQDRDGNWDQDWLGIDVYPELTQITLQEPPNGGALADPPQFVWEVDGGKDNVYFVEWDDDENFTPPLLGSSGPIGTTYYTMLPADWLAITDGQQVFWRVRGKALLLDEVVSDVWSFTKEACTPFTMALLGPADGETLSDPPTFSWGVDGGTNNVYTVQWSDVPNFAWILGESPPLAIPAWNMPQADWDAIPVGELTYWRVEGVSQDDPTCTPVYSAQVFSFTKQIVVPLTTITLQSPADGATLASPPTFSWGVDGGTDNAFAVDLSYSADFSSYWSTLGTGPIAGTSWPMPVQVWNQITAGQQVFWRVRGADLSITPLDVITSDQVWSFTKQP